MDEQPQQVSYEGLATSSSNLNSDSALKLRLDTTQIQIQFELYLRGLESNDYWNEKTNQYETKLVPCGEAKLNEMGRQGILNKMRLIICQSVAQGNFKEQFYLKQISDIRKEIAITLFINYYRWGMTNKSDLKEIPESMMNIIEAYLSRPIDNQERILLGQSTKIVENNTIDKSKSGIGGMFK